MPTERGPRRALTREEVETALRPVAFGSLRALERLARAGLQVPVIDRPKVTIGPDELRLARNVDFEWGRLAAIAVEAMDDDHGLFAAEAVIATALGEEFERAPSERPWSRPSQIVDVFLADFLRRALSAEQGDLESRLRGAEQGALEDAAADLASLLHDQRLEGSLLVPLEGVRFSATPIQMASGVEIIEFDPSLREELWSLWGWGSWSSVPFQPTDLLEWANAVRVRVASEHLSAPEWSRAQDDADKAISAIRLATGAHLVADYSWLRLDPPFAAYGSRLGAGGGFVRKPAGRRSLAFQVASSATASAVVENFRRLDAAARDGVFQLALRRFSSAANRFTDEDRLIDYWVAFEALFAPEDNRELRFRASLRIARFVEDGQAERQALFADLKRSYDWRSRIVHGGGKPSAREAKKLGDLPTVADVTEDALRRALCRWLDPQVSHHLGDLDAAFLG
jgi:hypothetical protein